MFKIICILFTITTYFSYCQNTNSSGKSYYFRISKNNSDFRLNNRIYFLNHNITDYDYTHRRVNIPQKTNEWTFDSNRYDSTYFIDEEWNFDHKKLNKTELPLFLHKFYEKTTSDVKTTTRILFNANRNSSSNIIKFNMDSLKPSETVLDAEFYFFWPLENSSEIYRQSVVLRLYQFEKQMPGEFNESTLTENPDVHKLFNVIYISKAQKGWQIFKVKKPVDNWLNGEDNLGLLLTISSYDDNKLISVYNDTNEGVYRSFAKITVQNNETLSTELEIRHKETESVVVPSCVKKDWAISFKKLQWDNFIIAPEGFGAYDCAGTCLNAQSDHFNHVKLLRIFNKRPSCCVPIDYLPLPVMFYDEIGNVVIKNYENMVVTKCGCR